MPAFFSEVSDKLLDSDFLRGVRRKYHYEEAQASELRMVAEEMLPLVRKEAFWERKGISLQGQHAWSRAQIPGVRYESVVMSLGSGLDCLQESYNEKILLSQSYMIEVLAGELLIQGYNAYNRYIRKNTGWHVARYHFPGCEEAFPIEMLPELLRETAPQVTCNAAFYMLPQKSVAFISELTQDEKVQCEGICAGCRNIHCANRMEL